ncbi:MULTISPECIES: ABC transporter ATP-binding protein [Methylobacterium]|jgi:multiple sugar transport system ATP-binding protein|uniref:ABC transporter ATP-binding protein n=1 Tax=Methylobacterium TaxID=407 RepID=UPI000EFBC132|nr:ABC transporter ATP-binding protein [Methylobacterium brachiatum]AYO86453.1 ABC transporter ATP-binding protein [Methylobacterium brachiatum]
MSRIDIVGIAKSFGRRPVLKGINLAVAPGEFMALVGPSGCGKSTMLRIIAGLEREDEGSIRLAGEAVDHLPARDRDLAMVFQSYALYPHLTVAENVAVPLTMRRLTTAERLPVIGRLWSRSRAVRREIDAEVAQACAMLGIGDLADRKPGQLSGGQRQRVALGRAMVRAPKAFLMDEPLSNLDAKLRVEMRSEIVRLHRRLETTFVYVTHDQAEAMTMADRIAVMMDGQLIQVGSPEEIYADPSDLRVAEFIGSPKINVAGADAARALAARLDDSAMALVPGLRLAFRAEAATLVDPTEGGLVGLIVHLENLGADLHVHLAIEGQAAPIIVRRDPHAPRLRLEERCGIVVPPERLLAFDGAGVRLRAPLMRRAA